jgi:O-antigen/teichoic acid export membrane protein
LLKLWVGHDYAVRSTLFLQILVLGNAVRQLGCPYAMVAVATGKQHLATIASVTEAVVNMSVSIFLVQRIGAVGVAIGTLAGAFVSLGMHLLVSVKFTHSAISMSRRRLILVGFFQPLLCVVPSLLLLPFWRGFDMLPASIPILVFWCIATCAIGWFAGLTSAERDGFKSFMQRLIYSQLLRV